MRKTITSLLILFSGFVFYAQVGVGTILPNSSAQLDVVASNKGILIPRLNIEDLLTAFPVSDIDIEESLLAFNTNEISGKGYYYWTGIKWEKLINSFDLINLLNSVPDDQQITEFSLTNKILKITLENGGTSSVDLTLLNGANGKSAYEVWIDAGNTGTETQFLASLKGNNGINGKSAFELWLDNNSGGTQAQFEASLKGDTGAAGANGTNGADGDSAYKVWLNAGNTGTELSKFIKSKLFINFSHFIPVQ